MVEIRFHWFGGLVSVRKPREICVVLGIALHIRLLPVRISLVVSSRFLYPHRTVLVAVESGSTHSPGP